MAEDFIGSVKEIEQEAEALMEEARSEARTILEEARRQAGDILSRSLPLDDADLVFEETAGEISPDTPLITYCDGEACSLSHDLAGILKELGFEEVRVLVNGWTLWLENALPVEQGRKHDERERSSCGS